MGIAIFRSLRCLLAGAGIALSITATNVATARAEAETAQDGKKAETLPALSPKAGGPVSSAAPTVISPAAACQTCCENEPDPRIWGSVEYLLHWNKRAQAPALVTTGNPADFSPGALGQPGTRILLGGGNMGYGNFNGIQATLGAWLDKCNLIGVEASGFLQEQRTLGAGFTANGAGVPPLYVPVFRADLGREGAFTIADPVLLGGIGRDLAVAFRTRFWGTELNGVARLYRTDNLTADLLVGARYLDLSEDLTLTADLLEGGGDFRLQDSFLTRNQFFGGQIGTRLGWHSELFLVELTTKIAFGNNHEMVDIAGSTTKDTKGAITTFRGGILTMPTNIGHQTSDMFAVAPEVNLKIGINVTKNITGFVAYDFLYLSNVVRAGDQIDRNINPTQATGAPLIGVARPVRAFDHTDFYSHGVNFGVELRF